MNAKTNPKANVKCNSLKAAQDSAPAGKKFVLVRKVGDGRGITWFHGYYTK